MHGTFINFLRYWTGRQIQLMCDQWSLRFLNRYFLKKEQRLVHGAEIYAGFLSNDKDFVENKHEPYFSPIYDTARGFFGIQSARRLHTQRCLNREVRQVCELSEMVLLGARRKITKFVIWKH